MIGAALLLAALRFAQGLSSAEIRTFAPYASNAEDLATDPWMSVRTFFSANDCIEIRSYTAHAEDEWLVVEVDGTSHARNARHSLRSLPPVWYVRVDANGKLAGAMSEKDFAANELLRAASDDERLAIVHRYDTILPQVARAVCDLALRTDRVRTKPAALFLLEWSQRNDDAEVETYAWGTLARLARHADNDLKASVKRAEMGRLAARRTQSCDLIAYADYVSATTGDDNDIVRQRDLLEPVIAQADTLDDPMPALRGLMTRAGNQFGITDLGPAYGYLDRLLALSQAYGWYDGELLGYHGRAAIKGSVSDEQGTIDNEWRVAVIAHRVLNKEFEARSANIIGSAYADWPRNDSGHAIPWFEHALRAAPKSTPLAATYHVNLGIALVKSGRLREAEPHLEPALAGGRAAAFIANAYLFGAELRHAQGRFREGIEFARKGIAEGESLYVIWELKWELGKMLIECGEVDDGIETLRQSIDLIEARRAISTSSGLIRARYFASRQPVYMTLLDTLVDQKRYEEAFAIAERMKARSLDDALAGDAQLQLSDEERARERQLNQRIIDLNRAKATGNLAAARAELEQFTSEMALRHARNVAAQAGSDPTDVVATWNGPPVIEYALLPDSIIAFVVRNGRVTARRIGNRKRIEARAARLLQRIEQRDLEYERDARLLYDALLAPVAPPGAVVDIVPDGFLWNVPFDLLRTPARTFVVERYAIAYAPSLMMLNVGRVLQPARTGQRTRPTFELLAFADPSLPGAVHEARAIADLYGHGQSTVLTGTAATESALKRLIGDYRVVHLATHGRVDDASPLYSAVVLAAAPRDPDDGLLEMREMTALDLHADLIVLSGCDTARGALYAGEGVIGMSWALLASGCPTTVVSQWKATSRATSQLMIEFHRRLVAGDSKAEALRGARLALMRQPDFRHPFYWAPFVIVGDGGTHKRHRSASPYIRASAVAH